MKSIQKILVLAIALTMIITMTQCDDTTKEFDEKGIILVNVKDEWNGDIVSNASIKVYKNIDDWAFEENEVKSITSDDEGRITITGLPEGDYFLDVISGDMTNWQSPYSVYVSDGYINVTDIYVSVNFNYYVSSAEGKLWQIKKVEDRLGNDLSADPKYSCMIGNNVRFEKAGYYSMHDGTDRCDSLPLLKEGSWWGYGPYMYLLTENGQNVTEYYIGTFNENYFILTDPSGEEQVHYRYELLP